MQERNELGEIVAKLLFRPQRSWEQPINIKAFQAFMEAIMKGVELVEDAQRTGVVLEKRSVHSFYARLVDTLAHSAKHLITPVDPFAEDKFGESPFLNIYICAASVLQYMKHTWPLSPDDMYFKRQSDIPVCKTFGLDVAVCVPICDMNVEELMSSLSILELNYERPLVFSDDLACYIDALELRLSDILTHTYDQQIQNVIPFRIEREGSNYHCSTAAEFQLVALMMGIHINKLGVLPHFRPLELEVVNSEQLEQICAHMHKVLIAECSNVYGDALVNRFRENYISGNVRVSEALMFMAQNGVAANMDPADAVEQFRGMSQWTAICEKAAIDPAFALEHPENDYLAWKLLFHIAVDMIMMRTINVSWLIFVRCGVAVAKMNDPDYQDLMIESRTYPIFVDSYNSACIIHREQLQKFGPTPMDYFKALLAWVEQVFIFHKNKVVVNCEPTDIEPLVLVLTSNIHHQLMAQNGEASSSTPPDEEFVLPKIVEREEPQVVHPIRELHKQYRQMNALIKEIENIFISKEMSTEGIISLGDHEDNYFVKDSHSGW